MKTAPVVFAATIDPEDRARADFYALLARLYHDAPDATVLAAIAKADELTTEDGGGAAQNLAQTWRALIAASTAMDPEAAADEYQQLFIGVGKSEVSLHASAYQQSMGGSTLADIRARLARLGLGRQSGVNVYEDHLAALCETMRVLITGSAELNATELSVQRDFFETHVMPWVFDCCNAIRACPIANYYRRVAELTESFMAIERDSFAIE